MNPAPNTPTPATTGHTKLPWYAVNQWMCSEKQDKRTNHVASFDYRDDPNEHLANLAFVLEACNNYDSLRQSHARLLEALKLGPNTEHAADERGPCLCGQCEFVRARRAAIASAQLTKETT